MKKILFLLLILTLESCWICPERHSLEFDNNTKTITVTSEGYYIKSIKMTEYIPKEGYIEYIDSNYVEITKNGNQINKEIDLKNLSTNYKVRGKKINEFLSKKEIAFEVWVINPKLEIENEDAESLVYFVIDAETNGKLTAESNGCK